MKRFNLRLSLKYRNYIVDTLHAALTRDSTHLYINLFLRHKACFDSYNTHIRDLMLGHKACFDWLFCSLPQYSRCYVDVLDVKPWSGIKTKYKKEFLGYFFSKDYWIKILRVNKIFHEKISKKNGVRSRC